MLKKEIFDTTDELVKEIVNCNYIIAMPKIKQFLEFIVKTPELVSLVSNCMKDIDYRREFLNCVKVSHSGKEYLEMHESPRYVIAVCLGLLYDIDKDNTILNVLMSRFFPNKNENISYSDMIFSIINPFVDSVKKMLSFDEKNLEITDKIETDAIKVAPEVILETIAPIIKEMNTAIIGENKLRESEARDFTIIVNGLYQAISISDMILIKSCYLSLLYLMNFKRKYRVILNKLTKEMTRYSLL